MAVIQYLATIEWGWTGCEENVDRGGCCPLRLKACSKFWY